MANQFRWFILLLVSASSWSFQTPMPRPPHSQTAYSEASINYLNQLFLGDPENHSALTSQIPNGFECSQTSQCLKGLKCLEAEDNSSVLPAFAGLTPADLVKLIKRIQKTSGFTLKNLKADKGTELKNSTFGKYCEEEGIIFDVSPTGIKQLHGAIERSNRSLEEGLMSLLKDAELKDWYWPFATETFTYVSNRTGKRMLNFMTPFKKFYGKKPDVRHLKIFGSKRFGIDGRKKKKIQRRGRPMKMLGYTKNSRSFKVLWLDTNVIGE